MTKKRIAQVFFWSGIAVGMAGLTFDSMSVVLLGGVLFAIELAIPFLLENTRVRQ